MMLKVAGTALHLGRFRSAGGSDANHERAIYDLGVKLVRQLVPEAMAPDDPLPERALLFRVHIDEITGRTAVPG